MEQEEKKRSDQQNKALHVLFELLAEKLNESGLDMRKTLKESIDIPWTKDTVKNFLWRPIQKVGGSKSEVVKDMGEDIPIINEKEEDIDVKDIPF